MRGSEHAPLIHPPSWEGAPMSGYVENERMPSVASEPWLKRPLDLLILVGTHLVLLPIFVLFWVTIPLAIWLDDRGPVFFRQVRVGKGGRLFTHLKFRTMTVDADQVGPIWTGETDPRVTRMGRVLRRTALDEMPQVVNIWMGDMSFVGPRALPVEMHEGYVADEADFVLRLAVRPGLTGLAAVHLPRHCTAAQRLEGDLYYVEHMSLWLDVKLIAQSVWLTVTGQWGSGPRRTTEPDADTHGPNSR